MNPLQELVRSATSTPGLTQDGCAWLGKALHPSDVNLPVNGIPTRDAVGTASLSYMTTATISAPGADDWTADVVFAPTPITFASVTAVDTSSVRSTTTLHNTTLGVTAFFDEFGTDARSWYALAASTWSHNVTKYRLTHASITLTMTASSVSNQGTLTCAQYDQEYYGGNTPYVLNLGTPAVRSVSDTHIYPSMEMTQADLQPYPGSVTWEARKGVYAITKFGTQFDKWHRSNNLKNLVMYKTGIDPFYNYVNVNSTDCHDLSVSTTSSGVTLPCGLHGCWGVGTVAGTGATTNFTLSGTRQYEPTSSITRIICVGLDPAASLNVTVRVGFEAIVPPASIYVGIVSPPVDYDARALDAYFDHARRMVSGYPADYNIFGSVLGALRGVARVALPAVSKYVMPALSGALGLDAPPQPTREVSTSDVSPTFAITRALPPRQPASMPQSGAKRRGRRKRNRQRN
jgi:hypothetical protein